MFIKTNLNEKHIKTNLEQIIALDEKYFPWPWNKSVWSDAVDNGERYQLYILKQEQDVKAFALFLCNSMDEAAHLLKILVLPEERGKALSKQFFSMVESEIKKEGYLSIYLEVSENNLVAINYYLKNGFEVCCVKRKYYSNGDNAFAMSKKID